ncbi:hypothetical protein [Roseivirga echinicomitans]|uniref:Uncharacterized protein n=1 Tax=Roseivirga echinicomitans TaxID=296218 RepID=A0A150WZ16_9BACT|nr:hypothetical protein [Roseivirga echinicomitans]KYG71532.1 hypothetical protein AWN68_12355 [Roseivirga echinicomitans]
MKTIQKTNLIAMIIGLVGVVFGVYSLATEGAFEDYSLSLFAGVVLFGTAYINNLEWKKKNKDH